MATNALTVFQFVLVSLLKMVLVNGLVMTTSWYAHARKLPLRRHHYAFSSIQMSQTVNKRQKHRPLQMNPSNSIPIRVQAKFVPELTWRNDAAEHKARIEALLSPGLSQRQSNGPQNMKSGRSLNSRHPVYNFLIQYYGIKDSKGVNRLMRWCPTPFYYHNKSDDDTLIQLNVPFPVETGSEVLTASTSSVRPSN